MKGKYALVTTPPDPEDDFQTIYWIEGDPRTPNYAFDSKSKKHMLSWFDIATDDEKKMIYPNGVKLPIKDAFLSFLENLTWR